MVSERIKALLVDLDAMAGRIQAFTKDLEAQAFQADAKTQSAVLHQFMVLGEAVKRLPEEFRRQ